MVVPEEIGDRVMVLIELLGENKNSFSKKIGIENNVTIGRIVNENRKPSFDVLKKILIAYPNVNIEWILTGEGPPTKRGLTQEDSNHKSNMSDFSDLEVLQHIHKNMDRYRESPLCKKVFTSMYLDDHMHDIEIERELAKEEALRRANDAKLK